MFGDEAIYFQQDGAPPLRVPLTSRRWTCFHGDTLKITFTAENQ
jgi:hypothetical protein